MIRDMQVNQVERIATNVGPAQRRGALVAGISLIIMTVAAMFAALTIQNLEVEGDVAATAQNILANEALFRLAVLSFVAVIVLDVLVAWGLYLFLRPVDRRLSLLAGWFRVVYAAVFMVAILELGNVVRILLSSDALSAFTPAQLQAQAAIALNAFNDGWALALSIFGIHLILVGLLAYRAGYVPKLLGILVFICGLGYLFDAVTGWLFPDFGLVIGQFTFFGEVLLGIWLFVKGISLKQWEKLALSPA